MNSNDRQEPGGGGFHTVQPLRDLESNWAVDLANNLEQYLLKICSGEIAGDDNGQLSVNFSEAALLLQGSIQVYSRKVEYLYSLVQHALEFISQKRQHDQPEDPSNQPEENSAHAVHDEENDIFWGSDDILVEAKNLLDSATSRDAQSNVKPPSNLVVLEGDCLDATGDGSELESYLLATSYLYRDFILLDPCDAEAVNDYFKVDNVNKGQSGTCRGSSRASKYRKSFQSPINASGGTGRKLSTGKKQGANPNSSPSVDDGFKFNDFNAGPDPPAWDIPQNDIHEFEMDDRYSDPGYSDDEDDPWKPLNPHEPGNLRVLPFQKVKSFRRQAVNSSKRIPITTQFPLAKLHGIISSELNEVWEARHRASERQASQSPPLYEKLRHSLVHGGHETCNAFHDPKGYNEENEYDDGGLDFGPPDFDIPESEFENEEVPLHAEKHDDAGVQFDINEVCGHENSDSQASLEDLCRSHLDALLASIAETEKQTEMAARVSTWKQRIEKNLEEQDLHPPFDIHEYGERVLEKLSLEADGSTVSFADVVRGQEKHDVARTFSALLQLVNNGSVDLDRVGGDSESVCYSGVNPFYVRLLGHGKKQEEVQLRPSKKRTNSPTRKGSIRAGKNRSRTEKQMNASLSASGSASTSMSSHLDSKLSLKMGKVGSIRCTPENKRRRKSRLIEPVDLHSAR